MTATMSQCVVKNCKSVVLRKRDEVKQIDKKITFHFIPKDPKRRKKWLEVLGLPSVSDHSRICSNHFPEDAFDRTSLSCIRLRDHAVPTLDVKRSITKEANSCEIVANNLSPGDFEGLSDSLCEPVTYTISDDEMHFTQEKQVESSVETTNTINTSVQNISNKYKSNIIFSFGNGDVPGLVPSPKPKLEIPHPTIPFQYIPCRAPSITCTPQRKPFNEEPEVPPCEACGTKKKRCKDRATSVSPERIFHCPDKKRIREYYEKEIKNYKQQMKSLNQKIRRLEASKNKFKCSVTREQIEQNRIESKIILNNTIS